MDFLEQELRYTRAAVDYTTSRRADSAMYGELCSMYIDARMADDPFLLDDYPDEEEIQRRLDSGEMYALWMDGEQKPVGAYVLTHDPLFSPGEEVLFRAKKCRILLPGENWFYPGKKYLTLKYPMVRPPLDPYYDVGALLEHAARTAVESGIMELRAKVNLQYRGMGIIYLKGGFRSACVVRRESNEAYVGFWLERYPLGEFVKLRGSGAYRSPAFESLSEEEYERLLEKMGIDEEEDVYYPKRRDDEEIILPPIK